MSTHDESRKGMAMHISPKRHFHYLQSNQKPAFQNLKEFHLQLEKKILANKGSTIA